MTDYTSWFTSGTLAGKPREENEGQQDSWRHQKKYSYDEYGNILRLNEIKTSSDKNSTIAESCEILRTFNATGGTVIWKGTNDCKKSLIHLDGDTVKLTIDNKTEEYKITSAN